MKERAAWRILAWLFGWLLAGASMPAYATTTATTTATITVFAAITFSPAFLAFGTQQIGSSVTQTLTVTNGGTQAFNFAASLTGPQAGQFSFSNTCNGALAVSASCQISATFTPTAAASDSAAITLSGSGRSYSAALSGTGSTMPAAPTPQSIALSPPAIQVYDNATGGSIVSTATVTLSDGTVCTSLGGNCNFTLTSSDVSYYTISGLNVVLAHGLTGADDGAHNTVITVQ